MTTDEYERLEAQESMLKELRDEYPGLTIDNIIQQIDSRINFGKLKQ